MTPSRRVGLAVKRAIDVAGAVTGLVLLGPVMAWTAVAIAATMGKPIFFRQMRPGLRGRPSLIWKFRTMRAPRRGEVWFDSDAARVTRLGAFLRTTSLDELPELWNVLRGDMSLVGPRRCSWSTSTTTPPRRSVATTCAPGSPAGPPSTVAIPPGSRTA
jgi:lipopolysaccharide/colanic/teichoic acid biosynthesis glycosyltransferase